MERNLFAARRHRAESPLLGAHGYTPSFFLLPLLSPHLLAAPLYAYAWTRLKKSNKKNRWREGDYVQDASPTSFYLTLFTMVISTVYGNDAGNFFGIGKTSYLGAF